MFLSIKEMELRKVRFDETFAPGELDFSEEAIRQAGLAGSAYQHLDATPTRVNGVEQQCHVLSTPLYVSYTTTPTKDRLAVLDVLRLGAAI